MATEYTITYKFTGQSNTSGGRSVGFDRFKAEGDTNRTIRQITSIQYVHYHSSTDSMNWVLRGRLVMNDGTTFTSDEINQHISGNIVRYTNTFTNLPTAEQFANLASIQTLDSQGKTTSGGYYAKLYWRANSTYPMQLIVKFLEEPPVTYAPKINQFQVYRVNSSGKKDDEGQYIGTTLKLSIGNSAGLSGATCRIYYAANAYPEVGVSLDKNLTSQISTLMTGVELNTTILTGVWNLGSVWNFAVVFTAGDETAIATASVARGTTSLHISDYPGGGAAIGGFSTGTAAKPKFESYVPAHFYGGIDGITNYSTSEVETPYKWIDGSKIYRKVITLKDVSANSTGYETLHTFNSGVNVINIFGYVIRASLKSIEDDGIRYRFPPCWYASGKNYHVIWMEDSKNLVVQSTSMLNGHIILEYTK